MKLFTDMDRSSSNDSNDGSVTEAQLDLYYKQVEDHQAKLKECNQDGIIKKLKHIIKLDEVRKNIYDTNRSKF